MAEVDLPLLHSLLGFLGGESPGRVELDVVSRHDDQGDVAGYHGEEAGDDVVHVLRVGDQEQDMSVSKVCHHSDTRSNST